MPETLPAGVAEAIPAHLRRRSRGLFAGRGGAWVIGLSVLVSLLALLPIAFVIGVSVQTGWATLLALVFRPRVGELLINTVLLVVITIPLCIVLGVTLAWLTERTDLPGRRWWSLLATAPLAVPAFVHSYAWVSLVPPIHGLFAGVLVSVIAYFPFLYLPIAATLRRLDPAIEDVAESLGLKPWAVFFRVVLPQLRLAICGGALLVGLHLLAEYGLYAMIRFDTFTTAIFDQFKSTFNGPAAQHAGRGARPVLPGDADRRIGRAWPCALCPRRFGKCPRTAHRALEDRANRTCADLADRDLRPGAGCAVDHLGQMADRRRRARLADGRADAGAATDTAARRRGRGC